jgi:GDP-L-fucose synthase
VIHAAIRGGKRIALASISDVFYNLKMYDNLAKHNDKFKLMINMCSGAAFDRRKTIYNTPEFLIHERQPLDYYGLSKNLIARKIHIDDRIHNLRLFGCFGPMEEDQRLIRSSFKKIITGNKIVIHQDKYMDFFYVEDLCRVIEYYFDNHESGLSKDINLCYENKKTLKDIVFLIKHLTSANNNVILQEKAFGKAYTGDYKKLKNLNLPLDGLENGIEKCLKKWMK